MKYPIYKEENHAVCISYTVLPKDVATMIFYIDGSGVSYNVDSLLQFGVEYKGKGYLCKVINRTTECVPIENVGMSLDMFR